MRRISEWYDLRPYGINFLTGEACGIGYRILCDVTGPGRDLIASALGLKALELRSPWNGGEGVVGCVMLPHELLVPLAVFALLGAGCNCVEVVICEDGVRGLEADDKDDGFWARVKSRGSRTLRPKGTAPGGMRNTHEMSGRTE